MLFQDKILDFSRIFRNLLLELLIIEISVFHHLWWKISIFIYE